MAMGIVFRGVYAVCVGIVIILNYSVYVFSVSL